MINSYKGLHCQLQCISSYFSLFVVRLKDRQRYRLILKRAIFIYNYRLYTYNNHFFGRGVLKIDSTIIMLILNDMYMSSEICFIGAFEGQWHNHLTIFYENRCKTRRESVCKQELTKEIIHLWSPHSRQNSFIWSIWCLSWNSAYSSTN